MNEHKVPLLIGGDVFHKWNPPPELINFALTYLPDCYAIAGNHDLPYHDYNLKPKSAYHTLCMAGKITDMQREPVHFDNGLSVHPFPYSFEVKWLSRPDWPYRIHLALVHEYVWYGDCKYPDAPKGQHVARFGERLAGYDCAAFGDNHKGFSVHFDKLSVMNCGGFYRGRSDEIDYKPRVGIVYSDGKIRPHFLDTSKDKWIDDLDKIRDEDERDDETDVRAAEFMVQLARLGDSVANFKEVVENMILTAKLSDGARRIALAALEAK